MRKARKFDYNVVIERRKAVLFFNNKAKKNHHWKFSIVSFFYLREIIQVTTPYLCLISGSPSVKNREFCHLNVEYVEDKRDIYLPRKVFTAHCVPIKRAVTAARSSTQFARAVPKYALASNVAY